ncbi:fibrinogen-like protein 1 isoform X2 [Folsomia candida]|uniref:fibrinogen-like protein 1 isoform X2 n=1 Tax=Folsomia candida TaxID=158441 RepID=UPI001604C5DB|nr:fibrinogen-like protein 1 isoform X2 [Folsomia candida]
MEMGTNYVQKEIYNPRKRRSIQAPDYAATNYQLGITPEAHKSNFNQTCQFVEQLLTVQKDQATVLDEIRNTSHNMLRGVGAIVEAVDTLKHVYHEIGTEQVKACGYASELTNSTFRNKQLVCDKGWTLIQRRGAPTLPGSERTNFERNWEDYENGFGTLDQDFWLGLQTIHELTMAGYTRLRVDLEDWEGHKKYAMYGVFKVGGARDKYKLTVGEYTGTAGNSLSSNSGEQFSTYDNDNDANTFTNCAAEYRGGWWQGNFCSESILNSVYHNSSNVGKPGVGVIWWHWTDTEYSLKKAEMKVRKPSAFT